MTPIDCQGKVAIVTAAGAGIGRAIALAWARGGGIVIVADRDDAAAAAVTAEIQNAGGAALALHVDVTDLKQIEAMVQRTIEKYRGLDALFNVAGVNMPKNVEEASDEEWRFIMDTNLTSVYRCSKHAIPELRRRGGGSIVNISSAAGIVAENRCAAYSASKAAVNNLTRNMAMDFSRDNIRVNAVCPGATETPRLRSYFENNSGHEAQMVGLVPMARVARPDEIAQAAVFLASGHASYITGATLAVDGGLTAGLRFTLFEKY